MYRAVCTSYIGEHLDCALKSGNSEDPPSISPGMRKTLRNQPAGTRPQQRNTTTMHGKLTVHYSCGSTKVVDTAVTQWRFVMNNASTFVPSDQPPPPQPKNATKTKGPNMSKNFNTNTKNLQMTLPSLTPM